MRTQVTIPTSGALLVSHLAAYGLAFALDAVGMDAVVGHDPGSQSFEPFVAFAGDRAAAGDAVRASAAQTERVVEEDIEPGKSGNDRRAVAWARASFANDPSRAGDVLGLREALVAAAERERDVISAGLLAGLGTSAAWGAPDKPKPSEGATALDGVLGNHTSDLVRGVLRPARKAAAALDGDLFVDAASDEQLDKSGWAPPSTQVTFVEQWLAVVGLSLLPVAHRPLGPSATPACWTTTRPRRHGVTLPVLGHPVSLPRLRALLSHAALTAITGELDGAEAVQAAGQLRALGVNEVVVFERRYQRGSGSSVGFTYQRGRLIGLR